MEKIIHMVVFGALFVAILLQVTTAQTVHVVGEDTAWIIPLNGPTAYESWASDRTFKVGDTLVFNFNALNHGVQEVSRASFEGCNMDNAIGEALMTSPANFTLTPGEHYYICTDIKHCEAGQRLAITVAGTDTPEASDPTSSTAIDTIPQPSSSTIMFASFLLTLSSIALATFL
ncbi:cucumber peeling cupredoxin-like isoform X1 [Lycium ferocissimum]|uniref:cucumber peeling cupredoxin-like isoform X1 n=1 Tax=Lycium ferocissimum TaxID=112874 RepID=UPI002815D35B|nr:cucumber peeling cupredoxin-like isoform X1 [Lycium ferocissimum]